MSFEPIKKTRVYSVIIKKIKKSVEQGELKPGDQLPSERDLSKRLSVSRSAVREAISVLESSGIVERLHGVGVFLKKNTQDEILDRINTIINKGFSRNNLIELIEVRQGIEVQAAFLAATRRTEEDVKLIKNAFLSLKVASLNKQAAVEEDFEFHLSVVKASHNNMLLEVFKIFNNKFLESIKQIRSKDIKFLDEESIKVHIEEHYQIYLAIVKKDSKKAKIAMNHHLENIKSSYLLTD